jgi:DNA helicase HerA-like ATPase
LITRLEARAADPRYGFIFNPPDDTLAYPWLSEAVTKLLLAGGEGAGIKIVNLSEVPSVILPMVAGVLARLVYDVQFWTNPDRRAPVALVCDEAHLYVPARDDAGHAHRTALETYESIAKEVRKYGVSLLVASQRPSDISGTIVSQCNNFIIMRLSNDHDRAAIERLVPEALSSTTGVIPALDVAEAVLIGDALPLPTRIKFDPPAIKPVSATQPYWSLWAERPSSSDAIAAGAEALRNRLRANE